MTSIVTLLSCSISISLGIPTLLNIATRLNGMSVNGTFPKGTLVTRPFWIAIWQMSQDLQNLATSPQTPGQKSSDTILSNLFLMPKCSVNKVSCANLRTFSRNPSGTTSCKVTLFPFVNCLYNKPFFRTSLVSPLFKPILTVMFPDSTLLLILSKFGSVAWACFKASLTSLIIWSGTLSFAYPEI